MSLTISYKKFALKQRIRELEKAIKRIPKDEIESSLYRQRQEQLNNLNKDLDGIIDEEK